MNCNEFRQTALGEPGSGDVKFREHRLACADCRQFVESIERRDAALAEALAVPVPAGLREKVLARAEAKAAPAADVRRRLGWAAAAALLLTAGLAGVLLQQGRSGDAASTAVAGGTRSDTLGAEVVEHIEHEAELLARDGPALSSAKVNGVLRRVDATMIERPGVAVSYAGMCRFRGKLVPHLVVQGEQGPITVMLLPDEPVSGPMNIEEGDFRGTLFSNGDGGSIAIVGGSEENIPEVQEKILNSVEWSI